MDDEMCDMEASKSTVAVTAPMAGTIVGFNGRLANTVGLINTSAELDGSTVRLEVAHPAAAQSLMYQAADKASLTRGPPEKVSGRC